jgi:arylsulfatase A-like enzyme
MTEQPNIIFYVSDSLRADHLSCYGYDRETSPNIDRLAEDSIRFEQCFAQAYKTVESSVSILTGLYPPAHQARTTYDTIPEGAPRIASQLSDAGYTTAGFSSLVQVSKRRGFDEGFDTFEELFRTHKADDGVTDWAGVCSDRAIEWLEHHDNSPFFLFIWSNGTHDPYAPRANAFTEDDSDHPIDGSLQSLRNAKPEHASRVQDLYDDTIRHADAEFGRLLDYLERANIYDETALVFTADHGELLSEHGRLEHAYEPAQRALKRITPEFCRSRTLFDSGAFVGHLGVLPYDELLHVPAIVKPSGGDYTSVARDRLVETVDFMPTIADLVGVPFETQGKSLRPLFGGDRSFKEFVYSDTAISRGLTQLRSVRSGEYKLIQTDWALSRLQSREALELKNAALSVLQKTTGSTRLLFELPDERIDVSSSKSDIQKEMATELNEWFEECEDWSLASNTSKLDPETKCQLRELGYME